MGRFPQESCKKGSQRWLQSLVNNAPDLLDEQIGLGRIDWRFPLRDDDFAEYRDQAFLDLLNIKLTTRPLAFFWPPGGPQWDGLGRAASGEVILVEAKAHLNELYSPATAASAESSLTQIQASLAETARGLGAPAGYDWSNQSYQYGNRLAHAYFLIGDADVGGPATRHQDLSTTQRYMHLSPAALDSAIRLLDEPGLASRRGDILETPNQSIGKSL